MAAAIIGIRTVALPFLWNGLLGVSLLGVLARLRGMVAGLACKVYKHRLRMENALTHEVLEHPPTP